MNKVAIVTDSTSNLPKEVIGQFNIVVIPLNVTIGEETFLETELINDELFAKLEYQTGVATTSQPSTGIFLETYNKLLDSGYNGIVSIHISSGISGTVNAALIAKQMTSEEKIHVYDSGITGPGLGLLAWAAAEWAKNGMDADSIVKKLFELKARTEVYFVLDTLDYLYRGGRIGGASAFVCSVLHIKPILYFHERGEIDVFAKARSRNKAFQRVLEELKRAVSSGDRFRINFMYVDLTPEVKKLMHDLEALFPMHYVYTVKLGSVLANHVGPGMFGIAFCPISTT